MVNLKFMQKRKTMSPEVKDKIKIDVNSEFGELEAVIIHSPGQEVENMTPENAERALYSDILNLSEATREYSQFKAVLEKHALTIEVKDLLKDILSNDILKKNLITNICSNENVFQIKKKLLEMEPEKLAKNLIEGVEMQRNTLTQFLSGDRFSLKPLHNFFFTRDASASINDFVLINPMANNVRKREAIIMETIFQNHPLFESKTFNPANVIEFDPKLTIEGGDILVAREDVLIIGNSMRTSTQGIDYILEKVKAEGKIKYIIVQELPKSPESFIHLDMTFTFLSPNEVLIYEPVILNPNQFKTLLIEIEGNDVKISEQIDILKVLKKLKFEVEPIHCGGKNDSWIQEREQWHSGANLFAMGPGKLLGYGRNVYTLKELSKHGYEIIKANDVIKNRKDLKNYEKYVVTIDSSELSRGGGGCRCMTMPVKRKHT